MNLTDSIEKLPHVGGVYTKRLKRLDIKTIRDLLYHFPFRYEDFSKPQKVKDLVANSKTSISGEIFQISDIRTKAGKRLTKAVVVDKSGSIEAVWFNQPYLARTLKKGTKIGLAGKVEPFGGRITLVSPEFEILNKGRKTIHTAGLVPVYPETTKVSSKWLRAKIKNLLGRLPLLGGAEFIPETYLRRYQFPTWDKAIKAIHFPKSLSEAKKAQTRFAFEELLLFNLRTLKQRNAWKRKKLPINFAYEKHKNEVNQFIQELPFELTNAQKRVVQEVLTDLEKEEPMNRLLEGDVGSGKTVVAAIAAYLAYLAGARTIFMAPTEVLVDQHFQTLKTLLEPKGVKIAIHTGAKKVKKGDYFDLWVGTHALFYRNPNFEDAGLVIIDEQHRFGVEQRAKLLKKARGARVPHLLTLTATPIPRTLALTVYGDLDLSILDELPPGRKRVKTFVVPSEKRKPGYEWIHKKVKAGDQAFVICPLIEESIKESMRQVRAATAECKKLQKLFPDLKLGLLHGRLKSKEKESTLGQFRSGKTHILVSTPVVEVGIDVPGATIMVVEAAERFGLASLHQLRGRVGRGEKESYCFFFTEDKNPNTLKRLKTLEKYSNGFELAELDLKMRGPGEIYGTRQHGLTELKIADLTDAKMLKISRDAALEIIKNNAGLVNNPPLAEELKRFSSTLVEPN